VEQKGEKKEGTKRRRTTVGKGTAKMILEGKADSVGKLQDTCIKVPSVAGWLIRLLRDIFMMWRRWGISVL
jgi:hypothetical protein